MAAVAATGSFRGVWGPPTSTIDWCEKNHEYSPLVAEWWNTVSNVGFVIFSVLNLVTAYQFRKALLEPRFLMLNTMVTFVGIGSALFHGTLLALSQQADETPMVFAVFTWIYILHARNDRKGKGSFWLPLGLAAYAITFGLLHAYFRFTTVFQLHFGVLEFVALYLLVQAYKSLDADPTAKRLLEAYCVLLLTAFGCWIVDFHLCSAVSSFAGGNPQLHAWWHVLASASTYSGTVAAQYMRARQMGYTATVTYWLGVVPIIGARKDV